MEWIFPGSYQPEQAIGRTLSTHATSNFPTGRKNRNPDIPFISSNNHLKNATVQQNSEGNSMNSWLVNRDPYFMIYYKLYLAG